MSMTSKFNTIIPSKNSELPAPVTMPVKKRGRPVLNESESIKKELIEKSAQLFRKKGYGNTTVRDIAAAVGIQSGSWFYHFKTKHEILVAVMEQGMQRSLLEIEAIAVTDLPPRMRFQRLVEVHLHTLLAPDHDFIPVLLYEWRSVEKAARLRIIALKDRYEAVWNEVMLALQASGDWAMPTGLDKLWMFGTLNWTAQWYRRDTGIGIEQLAEQAVQFILRTPASRN
ncbi:TetR/AcrR family transcriptional regulator [Undibacterium sp. TJN19]|uniref:TetR/AcrR family transcriptional regulator n=1 Tax=Undibacterium sp. TJN19 TaxID=3413055 RepID=UPI003BF3825E